MDWIVSPLVLFFIGYQFILYLSSVVQHSSWFNSCFYFISTDCENSKYLHTCGWVWRESTYTFYTENSSQTQGTGGAGNSQQHAAHGHQVQLSCHVPIQPQFCCPGNHLSSWPASSGILNPALRHIWSSKTKK